MKFFAKIAVAVAMGVGCVYLVVRDMDAAAVGRAIAGISLGSVGIYLLTMSVTLLFRAWRWNFLLKPIGVSLKMRELLPVSLVGFMAILALPVRLGEFVRPYFVVRQGRSRMSAVLGTVAVERIVDGLLISILFFTTYLISGDATFSPRLRFAAWLSLCGFLGLTVSLLFALRWPDQTIRLGLSFTFVPRFSPRLAAKISDKLRALIRGFGALKDARNMGIFLAQSIVYWAINGFGMWILARGMGLQIPLVAAYAAMSFTGVLISLPNAPGLVGQFHLGIVAALGAYLPASQMGSYAIAYATVLHGIQLLFHALLGFVSLWFVPGGAISLRQAVSASNDAAADLGAVTVSSSGV